MAADARYTRFLDEFEACDHGDIQSKIANRLFAGRYQSLVLCWDRQLHDWKAAPNSLAWLHGKPGCGKTPMCAQLIHAFDSWSQIPPIAMAFIFFEPGNFTSIQDILRSLLKQLAMQEREDNSPRTVVLDFFEKYPEYGNNMNGITDEDIYGPTQDEYHASESRIRLAGATGNMDSLTANDLDSRWGTGDVIGDKEDAATEALTQCLKCVLTSLDQKSSGGIYLFFDGIDNSLGFNAFLYIIEAMLHTWGLKSLRILVTSRTSFVNPRDSQRKDAVVLERLCSFEMVMPGI